MQFLAFSCHHCGSHLEAPEASGRWIQCPHCLANTEVPEDAERVEPPLPPAERPAADHHEKDDPGPVEVRGRRLVCPVCDGELFWSRRTLMNTAMATLFEVEYLNKTALAQICAECSYIFWFFED